MDNRPLLGVRSPNHLAAPRRRRAGECLWKRRYYEERSVERSAKGPWIRRIRGILDVVGYPPHSVLDFGAGEGHLVSALREMCIAADGIETSPPG